MTRKRSSLYQHVNKLLGGKLDAELRRLRKETPPLSLDEIVRAIGSEHEVYVSRETIRNWLRVIEEPKDAA